MDRPEVVRASDELFDVFGLDETRGQIIENLSHGARDNGSLIASALLHQPKVIIIDEPMVGLDPRSAAGGEEDVLERERSRAPA